MDMCPYSLQLSAYHDGELPEARRRELEQHLQTACAPCQAELRQWRRLSTLLTSPTAPQLSEEARQSLYRLAPMVREAGFVRVAKWATALAASVLLAVSGWMVVSRQGSEAVQPVQTVASSSLRQFVLNPSPSTDLLTEDKAEPHFPDWVVTDLVASAHE
jgi:anti-sigma factor RsiW